MSSDIYLNTIPLFPLLAFLVNSLVLKTKANIKTAGIISFVGTFLSFVCVCLLFGLVKEEGRIVSVLWNWSRFSDLRFDISFMADQLSIVLLFMVTGIGSLITLFSIGYMGEDTRPGKFFSYLSLFIFSMLLLVLGENFLVLFFGWEGVGLCSYLLIGFWYEDIEKAKAGRKAFIVNRIGDFGVVLGMAGLALVFKTLSFVDLQTPLVEVITQNQFLLTVSLLCVVLGVAGKSAQLPLYIWLPDAMAGPTPVSALIHAATMVTAGIFLLCRLSNLLIHLPVVMDVIAFVGVFTALCAALIALTQQDIKKVLAYSTVSQLGYMVLACGVGAFSSGIFHVFTHAFFKALLFLGAGAIIYSLHHQQDIFKMGGLKKKMPIVFWCFVVALFAINGVPGFSGFFSKDEILWMALNHPRYGTFFYGVALFTALCTAFYMTRLVCVVFLSRPKYHEDKHHPIHEAPYIMTIPLVVLALFSFGAGFLGLPEFLSHENARGFQSFVEMVVAKPNAPIYSSHTEHLLMIVTIILILASMGLAYFVFVTKEEQKISEKIKMGILPLWKMSFNKFYVDEIYVFLFVVPFKHFTRFLFSVVEVLFIDAIGRGIGFVTSCTGAALKKYRPQSLEQNLTYMVIGIAVFLTFIFSSLG